MPMPRHLKLVASTSAIVNRHVVRGKLQMLAIRLLPALQQPIPEEPEGLVLNVAIPRVTLPVRKLCLLLVVVLASSNGKAHRWLPILMLPVYRTVRTVTHDLAVLACHMDDSRQMVCLGSRMAAVRFTTPDPESCKL